MPGNLLNIDTEFPTFTGEENEREMVNQLVNYLHQLEERLRYTLMNLDRTNFNQTALDEITTGAAGSIAEQVQTLANQLNQTNGNLANLTSRVGTAEGNITDMGGDIQTLQGAVQVDGDGDITVGGADVAVEISGDVTINGVSPGSASVTAITDAEIDTIMAS